MGVHKGIVFFSLLFVVMIDIVTVWLWEIMYVCDVVVMNKAMEMKHEK